MRLPRPGALRESRLATRKPYSVSGDGTTNVSRAVLLAGGRAAVDRHQHRILPRRVEVRRELQQAVERRSAVGGLVGEELGLPQAELRRSASCHSSPRRRPPCPPARPPVASPAARRASGRRPRTACCPARCRSWPRRRARPPAARACTRRWCDGTSGRSGGRRRGRRGRRGAAGASDDCRRRAPCRRSRPPLRRPSPARPLRTWCCFVSGVISLPLRS